MITSQIRSCNCLDFDSIGLTIDEYDDFGLECWLFDTPSSGYNVDPAIPSEYDNLNIRKIGVITIELHETSITIIY